MVIARISKVASLIFKVSFMYGSWGIYRRAWCQSRVERDVF